MILTKQLLGFQTLVVCPLKAQLAHLEIESVEAAFFTVYDDLVYIKYHSECKIVVSCNMSDTVGVANQCLWLSKTFYLGISIILPKASKNQVNI